MNAILSFISFAVPETRRCHRRTTSKLLVTNLFKCQTATATTHEQFQPDEVGSAIQMSYTIF